MAKIKFTRLPVPAKLYDSALEFVNKRRADLGLTAIKELPAGLPGNVESCPCATLCKKGDKRIRVGGYYWYWVSKEGVFNYETSSEDLPKEFIHYFDQCAPLTRRYTSKGFVKPIRANII